MLFKGTATRSAEDIAQQVDSIGGQLDAFTRRSTPAITSRCSTSTCRSPSTSSPTSSRTRCSPPTTSSARRKSCSKRSRWSRTRPTISCTRSSRRRYWNGHPLGRPDSRARRRRVSALDQRDAPALFPRHLRAPNFVVVAVGNLEHDAREAAGRREASRDARRPAAPMPIAARSSRRACRSGRRISSRATCASARRRCRRIIRIATPATRSTPCSAGR